MMVVFVALGGIGFAVWSLNREPAAPLVEAEALEEPVEIVAVATDPTYVGRKVCGECHSDNFRLHSEHGHASTFANTRDPEVARKFVGKSFDAGPNFGTFSYDSTDDGIVTRLPERFADEPFLLEYAMGSGHNAITLFSLIPEVNEETIGLEHRATWFRNDGQLGLTPGHPTDKVPQTGFEFFGESHGQQEMQKCVGCHTTTGHIVGQEIVNLTPNVNCERCHGPGSQHVREARNSATPPPFSVGRDDWTTESELRLCGSCHRMPENFSRKELRKYPNTLVRFQPIGLLRSECYLESDGLLKCTTCHNPHETLKKTSMAKYVQTCIDCHLENSPSHVACPVSPQQGCIECHMKTIRLEHDVPFHDHWIRVHDEE